MEKNNLEIVYCPIDELKPADYNPRRWNDESTSQLKESIKRFGLVDPIVVNSAPERRNIVIGGHFRLKVAKDVGFSEVPVVYLNIPDVGKEQELNLRLNRNLGEFDFDLLVKFDQNLLADIGFSSEELDGIFQIDESPEVFDLNKELGKLDIKSVTAKKGDTYQLGSHRLIVGDSTDIATIENLTKGEKVDMCLTDPPYRLDYLNAKRHGSPTEGFGYRKDRKYLETDVLPADFTEKWVSNVANVAGPNFSIIVYESWRNIREVWAELEKYWKVKNMLVWHLPNRHQGFSARYKFFSKHDIAMVGAGGTVEYNYKDEADGLQEEYETALYAISGKPQWEGYDKGKKYQPTDFIEFNANDEKHSGQGVVFGTKPLEILIPYIKVLTRRGELILEPFGGSGSTLIAAQKMDRRCYVVEKSPVYAEVIMKRWEKLTDQRRKKLDESEASA